MKQTLNVFDFRDAFQKMGRADQFSYEGLGILFEFFEELGEDMELDVIAICCKYEESMPENILYDYSLNTDALNDEEILDAVIKYLDGAYIGTSSSGSIVYTKF